MHDYPADLARLVHERLGMACPVCSDDLTEVLSSAYQASMMRDEERPVTFRLALISKAEVPGGDGPPSGIHRLDFSVARPLTPDEIRRLSAGAKFHRALLGVQASATAFEIWGLLYSGPRWLRIEQGGRGDPPRLPPGTLIIRATGPGQLSVSYGGELLAQLRAGQVSAEHIDIFHSRWLPAMFGSVREELEELHENERQRRGVTWPPLHHDLIENVSQHMIRRVISSLRTARHGGTILMLPETSVAALQNGTVPLRLKYSFVQGDGRSRYRRLMLSVMSAIADCASSAPGKPQVADWSLYSSTPSPAIAELEESTFELGHLIAGLAEVDGAVVMSIRFELLGFGAEILGDSNGATRAHRALDLEGRRTEEVDPLQFGTRHRSAYRLCHRVPGALAIVVSQDGGVQFVTHRDDGALFWSYHPLGVA